MALMHIDAAEESIYQIVNSEGENEPWTCPALVDTLINNALYKSTVNGKTYI